MKRMMIAKAVGATLMLSGMLQAAHADAWVMKDAPRPHGHARPMAARRADANDLRSADAERSDAAAMQQMNND
jgi:hypothetical protein